MFPGEFPGRSFGECPGEGPGECLGGSPRGEACAAEERTPGKRTREGRPVSGARVHARLLEAGDPHGDLARVPPDLVVLEPAAAVAFTADPHCLLVLGFATGERGEEVAGLAHGHLLPRPDGRPAKLLLYAIDTLVRWRRRGVARAMLREFQRAGRQRGAGSMFVLTDLDDDAARSFYRATGGRPEPGQAMFSYPL